MMCAMAGDGQWLLALSCLQELRGRSRHVDDGCGGDGARAVDECEGSSAHQSHSVSLMAAPCFSRQATAMASRPLSPGNPGEGGGYGPELSEDEFHCLLNSLGCGQRWMESLGLFSERYLSHESGGRGVKVSPLHPIGLNLVFASFPRTHGTVTVLVPDEGELLTPRREVGELRPQGEANGEKRRPVDLEMDTLHCPHEVVALLDKLFNERDDVVATDCMIATVAPALLQLGDWSRALHLVRQAPCLSLSTSTLERRQAFESLDTRRRIRQALVSLCYYMLSNLSIEGRCYLLNYFPHIFPEVLFRHLPAPAELTKFIRQRQNVPEDVAENSGSVKTELKTKMSPSTSGNFTSKRRSFFTQHTEKMNTTLKQQFAELYIASKRASYHSGDPHRDPRPQPKGLHDTANGWNFYGRGGEMVFMNHKRTAHPFSMHPKVMRSLSDPHRSWAPRLNSCWAHRERVRKWNGYSSV
ncbi:hypothetical protein ERJ75_000238900 [Trypanosoma vivax]|nr:hypothetical protein ERJ75_000238900 [Trypanosoma vivax]